MPLEIHTETDLSPPVRDSVEGVTQRSQEPPSIVSISDIHGYLESARSALLTLADHPSFAPVVLPGGEDRLHWAGENYVLVFNGDLIDRGSANEAVLSMVGRLATEAPPGRIRVTLGNHEAIVLSQKHFGFANWYSEQVGSDDRQLFLDAVLAGHVVAAYEGYNVTYAHAGSPAPYDVSEVNESLQGAARKLSEAAGTLEDGEVQRRVLEEHPLVLGTGDGHPKGEDAGLVWLDFSHLPADAPPQVVGHTRHREPKQKGAVFCQNVIYNNLEEPGGEAALVETPTVLSALVREADGSVQEQLLEEF